MVYIRIPFLRRLKIIKKKGNTEMEKGKELTPTQEKVFDFLKYSLKKKGYPPTVREIASNFGLKSPRGPQKTLRILERKGYLRKVPGESRAIEILGRMGIPVGETVSIPIVGSVKAGVPVLAIENI